LEPLQFLLGVVTFGIAVRLKKPIRKTAVITATQVLGIVDRLKTTVYGLKEEVEDIVAEAHYENMKKNVGTTGESVENNENVNQHEEN
jgi:hypothetical protein